MPRTPRQGIDYAGWSVTMFDGDKKIDKLLDAQGWKGFGVYFFLCQLAYKLNGYYLEWNYDDAATTARKMGGGVGSETVKQTVEFCLLTGLFDKVLFDRWNILTSKGIQRRFWAVAGERRVVPLYKDLWLLAPEETEGLFNRARFLDMSPTNVDMSPTNVDMSPTNDTKVKESKVKESKVKESKEKEIVKKKPDVSVFRPPTREEVRAYAKQRNSTVDPDLFYEYFDVGNWIDSKGQMVKNWKQKLLTWEKHNTVHAQPAAHTSQRAKQPGEYTGVDFWD